MGELRGNREHCGTDLTTEQATKEKEKELLKARKAMEQKKKDEINSLFTPIDIVQPKIPFGVGQSSSPLSCPLRS